MNNEPLQIHFTEQQLVNKARVWVDNNTGLSVWVDNNTGLILSDTTQMFSQGLLTRFVQDLFAQEGEQCGPDAKLWEGKV